MINNFIDKFINRFINWLWNSTPVGDKLDRFYDNISVWLPKALEIIYVIAFIAVIVLFAVYLKRDRSGAVTPRFSKASRNTFNVFALATSLASNLISYHEVDECDGEGLALLLTAPLFFAETILLIALETGVFSESKTLESPKSEKKCSTIIACAFAVTIIFNFIMLALAGSLIKIVPIIIANLIACTIQALTIYMQRIADNNEDDFSVQ